MKYNIIIPTILFGLTLFSCNQPSNKKTQEKPNSLNLSEAIDTSPLTEVTVTIQKPDFNFVKFVALTDSLLSKIQGKPISVIVKTDTIKVDKLDKRSFYKSLFVTKNCIIKRYSFDPGKGNRELRIWFVEASYQDTISTFKAFEELRKQSGSVDGKNDYLPGLTYTNDFVMKTSNKIYWINSGCPYAFSNHQKLKQFMLQSLQMDTMQDSIWCKCGQPKCSL